MEISEIKDLLTKMNALAEEGEPLDSVALMQDPMQQVDRDSKPELVIAPEGIESYFGYSVALAAWMRFLCAHAEENGAYALPQGTEIKKNEKAILVLDSYSEEKANALVSLAEEEGAKVVAVLALDGSDSHADHGCAFHSLL